MIILLILVDCLWSQWTEWTTCDCNVWKIGGNQDVFKYRTVFQSRYRAIHEDEDEKACVHLHGTESKKCPNYSMVKKCVPKSDNQPRKLIRISKEGKEKQPASRVIKAWSDKHGKPKK